MNPLRVVAALPLLLFAGCSIPVAYQPTGPRDSMVYVETCLQQSRVQAVITESVIDVTDYPEGLSAQESKDRDLFVRVTGQMPHTVGGPRKLVTVREFDPGPGIPPRAPNVGMVLLRQGLASTGGSSAHLHDVTVAGQPVYWSHTYGGPGEVLAVRIFSHKVIDGKEQSFEYWYPVPQRIPSSGFTEWMRPTYQKPTFDKPYVEGLLWSGKPLPVSEVDADVPRVRYTQIANEVYWGKSRDTSRGMSMRSQARSAGLNVVVEGPRRVAATVPAC